MSRPFYELDNVPSQSSTFQQMAHSTTAYLFRATNNPEPGFAARRDNDIEIEPTLESVSHYINYGGNPVASSQRHDDFRDRGSQRFPREQTSKSVMHVGEQWNRHSPDSKSFMSVGERRSHYSPDFTSKSVMRGEERWNRHSPDSKSVLRVGERRNHHSPDSKSFMRVGERRSHQSPDSKSFMLVGERRSRNSPDFTSKSIMRVGERRNHHSPDRSRRSRDRSPLSVSQRSRDCFPLPVSYDDYSRRESRNILKMSFDEYRQLDSQGNSQISRGTRSRSPFSENRFKRRSSNDRSPSPQNDEDSGPFNPSNSQMNIMREADQSASYLSSLGVNQETLKKMPTVLLTKFKKTVCEVCNMNWGQTKVFARLHYNSKQHARNVEKWLLERETALNIAKRKDMQIDGVQPRHIFCELCSVQFTSKSHMDAHYSGKQHLSIVNGSKLTKRQELLDNPDLLQLLITREKQFFDSAPKATTKPQTADVKMTKGKKTDEPNANLYVLRVHCEICNVSTSTEEQMVLHKNGKKHLQKEKERILQFCKLE